MLILFHLLRLLQGYRDMATYRKVFSVVKNPPYCQVIFLKKTGNMTHMVPSAWFLKWKREHLVPITAQTQLSSSVCWNTASSKLEISFFCRNDWWPSLEENILGPDCNAKLANPGFVTHHPHPHCHHLRAWWSQIAMRNGIIQDWGLVEFFDAQEAEQTQERMNGYNLGGRNIRWIWLLWSWWWWWAEPRNNERVQFGQTEYNVTICG